MAVAGTRVGRLLQLPVSVGVRRIRNSGGLGWLVTGRCCCSHSQLPLTTPPPCTQLPQESEQPHTPVLLQEVVESLASCCRGGVVLDMTFGGGGHTRGLLEQVEGVRVVCLDRDPTAHTLATALRHQHPSRVLPLLGKFSDLPGLLGTRYQGKVQGVVMDLGASSMQFDTPQRGFMLSQDGPLDMRMDADSREGGQLTAGDILAHIEEGELYKVLKYYGGESRARPLAQGLVEARHLLPRLRTTQELAQLVAHLLGHEGGRDKLGRTTHPATKTFQALRILVNNELNELDYGLHLAHHYLQQGGVLAAITFHSLEDTIVKRHIQGVELDQSPCTIGRGVSKHRTAMSTYSREELQKELGPRWQSGGQLVVPGPQEVLANPRSRSAKLRVAYKV